MTYRWQGHHVGDPGLYRPEEEVEEWKAKEPLKILEDKKLLTDEEIAEIKEMVEKRDSGKHVNLQKKVHIRIWQKPIPTYL